MRRGWFHAQWSATLLMARLNEQYRISEKNQEGDVLVVYEHNYHADAVAAGLRTNRTRPISLVISDLKKIVAELNSN